jgi:hypothetical protein
MEPAGNPMLEGFVAYGGRVPLVVTVMDLDEDAGDEEEPDPVSADLQDPQDNDYGPQ